jgi:putative membrane protein
MTQKQANSSRTREHLSNERTYLAWIRIAIAMIGFGVVIIRLRVLYPLLLLNHGTRWMLGLFFSCIGLLTVILSTQHYFAVRTVIDEDSYEHPDRWIILSSLAVLLLAAGVIYFVFTAPLNSMGFIVPK